MGADDGDGGNGCGFGAEDARAEGDGCPVVLREEGDFFVGPATFGADGERQFIFNLPPIAIRLRWMGHPRICGEIPHLRIEMWGTQCSS